MSLDEQKRLLLQHEQADVLAGRLRRTGSIEHRLERLDRTCERCAREFGKRSSLLTHLRYCGVDRAAQRQKPRPSPRRVGVVYLVVTSEPPRRVKIGLTWGDMRLRLAQLQCCSPLALSVLATWKASAADEWDVHREAAGYRLHGEWFTEEAIGVVGGFMARKGRERLS